MAKAVTAVIPNILPIRRQCSNAPDVEDGEPMARKPLAKTTQRGYGTRHQKLRDRVSRDVKAGRAICWRCNQPIPAQGPWDLGHDDHDRTQYRGPEHRKCNRSTAGRQKPAEIDTSRTW